MVNVINKLNKTMEEYNIQQIIYFIWFFLGFFAATIMYIVLNINNK